MENVLYWSIQTSRMTTMICENSIERKKFDLIHHMVYTHDIGGDTMDMTMKKQTTKVFMNGRSQAVRIPLEFRFEEDELYINKIGDTLMLTPKSSLVGTLRKGIELISDDFMEGGRPEEIPTIREEL